MNTPYTYADILDFSDIGGTLVFYTVRPLDATGNPGNNNVYWRDASSPQGFGPFPSLQRAMPHHAHTTKQLRLLDAIPPCEVIPVDFRLKKRL